MKHPRPAHEAWDGLVLDADNTWWGDTHYPPNGWGCKCSVRALSKRDLTRLGKAGPDTVQMPKAEKQIVGTQGPNPREEDVYPGIDPGWAYNVGKANSGQWLTDEKMAEWNAQKNVLETTIHKEFAEVGRALRIPRAPLPVPTIGQCKIIPPKSSCRE